MVDPTAAYMEVYRLENETCVKVGIFGRNATFESATLGKTVSLASVFEPEK